MTQERWHGPPPPSVPREAPWREIEEVIAGLHALSAKLDSLTGAFAAAYGITPPSPVVVTPTVPAIDGLDSIVAKMDTLIEAVSALAGAPAPTPTPGPPAPAPAAPAASATPHGTRYGVVSSGGTYTLTQRVSTWETNMWQGWEVEKNPGSGQAETRVVISNTSDTLTVRRRWDIKPKAGDTFVIRPRYPLDNPNSFDTDQHNVTTAGMPQKLPSHAVLNGFPVLIMAKPGNSGNIYLGNSYAKALNTSNDRLDKLEAGKSVALYVSNTNLIWIDSDDDGDGVSIFIPVMTSET
ncbi:MAG: hypothetical protein WC551_07925 [Patescibacteria group bacterium]